MTVELTSQQFSVSFRHITSQHHIAQLQHFISGNVNRRQAMKYSILRDGELIVSAGPGCSIAHTQDCK